MDWLQLATVALQQWLVRGWAGPLLACAHHLQGAPIFAPILPQEWAEQGREGL